MKRVTASAVATLLVLAAANAASAGATIYTDQAGFVGAMGPGYYLEDFSSFTYGSFQGASLNFGPMNGFSYQVASSSDILYSGPGSMSTNRYTDSLIITFTGSPVTAVGGIFWPTDFNGNNVVGPVTLTLSNGTVLSLPNADATTFRGFVTDGAALTSITIATGADGQWPTVDHLYVGQAAVAVVPAPGALGLVVLGVGFLGRRLRRKAA
jgi:hypothetical protein